MPESTIALIVSIVTAVIAVAGGWRLWLDSRTARRVQVQDVTVKEWCALLNTYKNLREQLESQLEQNRREIRELRGELAEAQKRKPRLGVA